MIDMLSQLCSLPGVSGYEEKIRGYIKEAARPFADEIKEDTMGNLIIFKKGEKPRREPFMVCAHMDEVGLVINHITDDGYLRFDEAGGIDSRVLPGKRVFVGEKEIPGVIGMRAVHLTTPEERKKAPKLSELCIDIGCEKKASAEKLVKLGDYVVFDSEWRSLGENRIKARAIDDRFGCAAMLKLLSEELLYDTFFAFTVQEEIGCRGARCAAFSVKPRFALVFDATSEGSVPPAEGANKVCTLGKGAVIGCMDRGTMYDKQMFELLRSIAEKKGISWQIKTLIAGGNDASAIHTSAEGVKTASISIPTRYIHSPSCVADIRDAEAALALARELINCEEDVLNA